MDPTAGGIELRHQAWLGQPLQGQPARITLAPSTQMNSAAPEKNLGSEWTWTHIITLALRPTEGSCSFLRKVAPDFVISFPTGLRSRPKAK